jgi:chemotaxis protein methyltransferase CheR
MTEAPFITDREFALFQSLVQREAGIYLSPMKKALLVGRLCGRMRELKVESFTAYHRIVTGDAEGTELVNLLDAVSTNETQFFREPRQFELLAQRLVPQWVSQANARRRPRALRAWSAACSTGEEPYSIAMTLFPEGLLAGWDVSVLGSDLSTRVVAHARRAVWPEDKATDVPLRYLKRFMLRGTRSQEGKIKVAPEVRALVRIERINLNGALPALGLFDLIFCRNVLIYFDAAMKKRVLAALSARLAPGGYLFLGHAETVAGSDQAFQSVAPNVYTRAGHARAGSEPSSRTRVG